MLANIINIIGNILNLDAFIIRALLGSIGIAIMAAPLGCFVIWKRMAYFGDSLAHSALLGIAVGMLLGVGVDIGIVIICGLFALLMLILQNNKNFANDTLLGLISHASLALGIIIISSMESVRVNMLHYLFGDILALGINDLYIIYTLAVVIVGIIFCIWRRLLITTINEDLAKMEGINITLINTIFMLLMIVITALSIRIVGILLITSLLIIPAASARQIAGNPATMAIFATIIAIIAIIMGIITSITFDITTGPTIIMSATSIFGVLWLGNMMLRR